MCGHVNNLDIQLQRLLQHYPEGIPQSVSQRLQKIIISNVQSPTSNSTITKNDTEATGPGHKGISVHLVVNNTKINKTMEKSVSGESKSIPLPSANVATNLTMTRNEVQALSNIKTNFTNHNEEKNNNTDRNSQYGETEYQTESKSNITKKSLNLKHKIQKVVVDHVNKHGNPAEKPVKAEKKPTVTTSSNSHKSKQVPHHKPKFTTLHQQKIKDNKDKNKLVSHMGTHPISPVAKVSNGLSELKQIPVTKKRQHPSSLHHGNSNLNHKANSSKRRKSSVISLPQSHTSSFARRNHQGKDRSKKHLKQNQNNFPMSRMSIPRKGVTIADTKTKEKEMSTSIFSFSSPRLFNQKVLKSHTPILPFNIRQTKKKFSLMPTENQLSRPKDSLNVPIYRKKGSMVQPTTRSPNSWKRPVPERQFPWENIPNKNMGVTPSPNTLYDQNNVQPTAPNNYYYDNFNFQETVHIDGPYPQNALVKPLGASPINRQQTWQDPFSASPTDRTPFENQRKPERLVINFQGSNKLGKSKSLTGSNKNVRKEVINSHSRKVGIGDTPQSPQQWSSQPSVVYSNSQDGTQNTKWNNRQRSSWQRIQVDKQSPSQQGSSQSSVVYSKFQDSPQQQNRNEINQRSALGKPRNVQDQRFNEKSGRNGVFTYTTTVSPPFYPNPSPSTSMFTSSSSRRRPQLDSQTNTHTFSQGTMEIGQNPSGWNDFKTPVPDKKASMTHSKPRDTPFHGLQVNKVSSLDITISPNFLYNQEQTSPYPRQVSQQQGYSKPQRNPSDITYNHQEIPKVAPWPSASTPSQTQTVVPTTYRNEFSRQDSFATETPNGWSMVGSLNKIQNIYGTTTPSPILQQGNNQELRYQNTQQRQNTNVLDYQHINRQNEIQQQPQQHVPFKQPQLKQGFQSSQQYYPDFQKETNQQQQNSFSSQGNHQQNSFQNQQQKPPQNEIPSPLQHQQSNQQQSELFGIQKKTFSNQQLQQTSQNQNENFSQQRQNSFPNQQKSNQQQIGKISNQYKNSPPIQQQTIKQIGLKQNQSLPSNQQNGKFDNSFQNQRQPNLQQNENFGQKQLNHQQNGPIFQRPQQQNQPQNGKMGEQQQNSFGNRQHQQQQNSFSNQQQQQTSQQQTVLMNQQRQNSFEKQQQSNVQQNTQNSIKNQQPPPQRQQQRKNRFNQIQRRPPIQQQRFQQQNKQQSFPQKPPNNAKRFAPNQGPFKRRKAKKIPAPAYVSNYITSKCFWKTFDRVNPK